MGSKCAVDISRWGLVVLVALGLAMPRPAQGQRYEDIAAQHQAPRVYHEATVLPGDSATVVVSFRIPNVRLVFLRSQAPQPEQAFVAEPEVTVEVVQRGRTVATQRWAAPHYVSTFEATQSREATLVGSVRFRLAPGTYAYRLRLGERATRRDRSAAPHAFEVPGHDAALHAPLLARRLERGGGAVHLDLAVLGGDAPFGQPAQAVVPVRLPEGVAPEAVALRAVLSLLEAPDDDVEVGTVVQQDTLPSGAWLHVHGASLREDGAVLRWATASPASADYHLVPIDLDGLHLADGAYALRLLLDLPDGTAVERTARFSTHWRTMPLALYHPEVAIRTLRFIEGRETVKALRRGSQEEQEQRIRTYWQDRDPTPGTVFNELMAEYYRRVDHAASAFRTAQAPVPDGLTTDAARVYVAYGPPDRVERSYPGRGGVEAVWHYEDGRRFVFWAPTSLDPMQLQARPVR